MLTKLWLESLGGFLQSVYCAFVDRLSALVTPEVYQHLVDGHKCDRAGQTFKVRWKRLY